MVARLLSSRSNFAPSHVSWLSIRPTATRPGVLPMVTVPPIWTFRSSGKFSIRSCSLMSTTNCRMKASVRKSYSKTPTAIGLSLPSSFSSMTAIRPDAVFSSSPSKPRTNAVARQSSPQPVKLTPNPAPKAQVSCTGFQALRPRSSGRAVGRAFFSHG